MKTDKFPHKAFAIKMMGKKAFDDAMTRIPSAEEIKKNELELETFFDELDLGSLDALMEDATPECTEFDKRVMAAFRPVSEEGECTEPMVVASRSATTPISIRVPNWLQKDLKREAKVRGVRYQTFINRILKSGFVPA